MSELDYPRKTYQCSTCHGEFPNEWCATCGGSGVVTVTEVGGKRSTFTRVAEWSFVVALFLIAIYVYLFP